MMVKSAKTASGDRAREDKRRQLLIYMRPEMIRMLKVKAMEDGRHAYELVEEAVEGYLKAQKRQK
jgi:hypothetical protein